MMPEGRTVCLIKGAHYPDKCNLDEGNTTLGTSANFAYRAKVCPAPKTDHFVIPIQKCPHSPHLSNNDSNHGSNATISSPADQTNSEKRVSSDQRDNGVRRNFLNPHPTPN